MQAQDRKCAENSELPRRWFDAPGIYIGRHLYPFGSRVKSADSCHHSGWQGVRFDTPVHRIRSVRPAIGENDMPDDGSLKTTSANRAGLRLVSPATSSVAEQRMVAERGPQFGGEAKMIPFDITTAMPAILRCADAARMNELDMYRNIAEAGRWWMHVCEWCDDKSQHDGKRTSAFAWARDNAPNCRGRPISKRWLDEHKKFYMRWDEFILAWEWAENKPYTPHRQPSLKAGFMLMDIKTRNDVYQKLVQNNRNRVRVASKPQYSVMPEVVEVNPMQTVYAGDVIHMERKHILVESIDLAVADPPYFLQIPDHQTITDVKNELYGMKPRFRAYWEDFPTIQQYQAFTEAWLAESMRCLHQRGSLFVFCSCHAVGAIEYSAQLLGINTVQHIQCIQLNQRPNVNDRNLQHTHHTIIWLTKHHTNYRFHSDDVRWSAWDNDCLNPGNGTMLRDTWVINHNGHENTTDFPSQKNTRVYDRLLTMCGEPGGMFLDLFSGSGTGAVAAGRWGMQTKSIERDHSYVADIIERLERRR
jgi:DNA modification methylase